MQIYDIRVICKGNYQIRNCGTDIADHNTTDDKNRHIVHFIGDQDHKTHRKHGTNKRCQNQYNGTCHQPSSQKKYHHQGCHQFCTGRNSQHKGACNGICKKGLKQKSGNRQGTA